MRLQDKSMGYARIQPVVSSVIGIVASCIALGHIALAQTPPEPPKSVPTEKQSPVNPFPFAFGDAQNRGRAAADDYWGIMDGNAPARPITVGGKAYSGNILSRVPNDGVRPRLMELDGWGFPRGASVFGAFLFRPSIRVPQVNGDGDGFFNPLPSGNWTLQTAGPSENATLANASYYRSQAQPRNNVNAVDFINNDRINNGSKRLVIWDMSLLQMASVARNQANRFQVRVNLPSAGLGENRINDARYTVYYYLRTSPPNAAPVFVARQKTFIISQAGGGETPLLNPNGIPAFFPFLSSTSTIASNNLLPVQPGLNRRFQGVVLDDTTTDTGDLLFVLADRINLVASIDAVYATPVVTRPHGGRRVFPTVAAGAQPFQPFSGPNYFFNAPIYKNTDGNNHAYLSPVDINNEWYNNLSAFVNNPFDAATIDPADPTDWTANPSTLFRGPESIVEPRLLTGNQPAYPLTTLAGLPVGPGTQNRPLVTIRDPVTGEDVISTSGQPLKRTASSIDSNNHNIYRANRLQSYNPGNPNSNPVVPYFSHQQVIMARTEYALDPEDGVAPDNKDGTLTLPVGAVYCLDGQTGAPIWRFPDLTYAPGNVRNPLITDPVTGVIAPTIPGIRAIDKNLNGTIEEDEVFIIGQGTNPSGGLFASITYAPKIAVRGSVKLPTYNTIIDANRASTTLTTINFKPGSATVNAPVGRYYQKGTFEPVMVGMAYIAAANGVVYAVDAYGNNDNDYFPNRTDYRIFGDYRPGTTNVLWMFAPKSAPRRIRVNAESLPQYYQRLKTEIPVPGSYGQSAPVLAYSKDEKDLTTAPLGPNDEPRLFLGNQAGYVYALDARADAGFQSINSPGPTGIYPLPFRKEEGQRIYFQNATSTVVRQITGVKWWFGTRGGINAAPAVSLMRQNAGKPTGSAEADLITKGVYVTSLEGRVYCIDWDGPVTRLKHATPVTLNNIDWTDPDLDAYSSSPFATIAAQLNDDYKFHNLLPANGNALADRTEGDIRPRWTYPNLYRDLGANAVPIKFSDPTDVALKNDFYDAAKDRGIAGKNLIEPGSSIGAITTPPVLMDFPFQRDVTDPTTREVRSYLTFQAHDATSNGNPPTESRVYLLDQVGDRANFLSNPVVRNFGATPRVSAYPRDRFSPKQVLGDSAPAWTYRFVYDTLATGAPNALDMTKRNSPIYDTTTGPILTNTDTRLTLNPYQGVPSRRLLPTLYVGGVGKAFAVDIDLTTGLFMRWRRSYNETVALTPLPDLPNFWNDNAILNIFRSEAVRDQLNPFDPSMRAGFTPTGALRDFAPNRVLARVLPLEGVPSSVNSVVISGGPMQNRSNTVPINNLAPGTPTVPLFTTNDAPNWRPLYFDLADLIKVNPTSFDFNDALRGLSHFVNQDINDPLTTTEGVRSTDQGNPVTDGTARIPNLAFQYPTLFLTDADGNLHSLSSNTEGEDRAQVGNPSIARSFTIGWALYNVTDGIADQIQPGHSLMFSQFGPGGPGGVAVVSNVYFPAMDPAFRNAARASANPASPYRNYPNGEPNTLAPTPYKLPTSAATAKEPLANNDDPRPDFRPRSLSPGVVAGAAADTNTGQSGFPLDANGLFFDKRFAGKSGVVLPGQARDGHPANFLDTGLGDVIRDSVNYQNANGSYKVKLRLPGYSYIGGNLAAADFVGPDNAAGVNKNNQVADGARRAASIVATVVQPDNIAEGNDDINPAAQNVAWIYAGGQGGLMYAFTPALSGQSSGGVAGTSNARGGDDRLFGVPSAKVAIVDEATYESIRSGVIGGSDPTNLAVNGSIARKGGRNFYEWGETVYVVVYDLIARTVPTTQDDNYVTGGGAVQIAFRNALQNSQAGTAQTPLLTKADGSTIAFYRPDNSTDTTVNQLGVALLKFRLGDNSPQFPQTPGDTIQVTAVQNGVRLPGRLRRIVQTARNTLENSDSYFSIANPLAVQGFLASTTGATLGVDAKNANNMQNGVGPFESLANQTGGPKARITFDPVNGTDGSTDPDKFGYDYAAALTNGNRVRRRDLRRYLGLGNLQRLNPTFSTVLRTINGADDAEYDFPIMANAGYVNHGDSGTTDVGKATPNSVTTQNLRIMNRSLLESLKNVRVAPSSSLIWRYWPGRVPNAQADGANVRFTPPGMDIGGRINPLPWETGVNEAKPWNPTAPGNSSPDYPDIASANAIAVGSASGNLVAAPGNLNAQVGGVGDNRANGTINRGPDPTLPLAPLYATAAAVRIPKYQPANLVATHNLTSSYIGPSADDNSGAIIPITEANPAPLQLPRGIVNRDLRRFDNGTRRFSGNKDIAPFGYTTRMTVSVGNTLTSLSNVVSFQLRNTGLDPNNRGGVATTYGGAAYREFEMSVGVPVDTGLQVSETTVDLGSLGHSFGIQDGLLGYGANGDPAYATGLLPAPLFDLGLFPGNNNAPYGTFFKKFTVKNEGNVNVWNLRAAQRIEAPTNTTTAGSGFPFRYLGLQSETVDQKFSILAVGADPNANIGNVMPQIATSLDQRYDAAWDKYLKTGPPKFSDPYTATLPDGNTPYALYYAGFAGRHTLHKSLPGLIGTSVASIPDLPSAQYLRPVGQTQPEGLSTVVGVAVPLGTPSGTYSSLAYGQRFVVFEDHDTDVPYSSVPTIKSSSANNLVLNPAGPLYSGSNAQHPGTKKILTRGNGSGGEGIWRYRFRSDVDQNGNNVTVAEPLPASNPGINLKVTVGESPLTGEVADRALEGAGVPLNVASGRLPAVDAVPIIDANGKTRRPAASLTPAAYRAPDGKIHLYYSRNYLGDLKTPFAQPGQPYKLFTSSLNWNTGLGAFTADNIGAPLSDARANQGKWFSNPQIIDPTGSLTESNVSPFVLQPDPTLAGATLYWVNSRPQAGGTNYNQIMFAPLDTNGQPTTTGTPFLKGYDPTLQRFSPRSFFAGNNAFVLYYGGVTGKWNLYYSIRTADTSGTPTGVVPDASASGQQAREQQLPLPVSITSATDPAPVYRGVLFVADSNPSGYRQAQVVDVFYSGVLRSTQTPDIFQSRYEITTVNGQLRLRPLAFARITGELLNGSSRGAMYQGRNISWNADQQADLAGNFDNLPIISIDGAIITYPNRVTAANRKNNQWQFDAATGVLYQSFTRNGRSAVVYVDAQAGSVRFRGSAGPSNSEKVYVDYSPTIQRLTSGGTGATGVFSLFDNRPLEATFTLKNPVRNSVIRRSGNGLPNVGRNWLFYQRGTTALAYASRRVGIDLRSIPAAQGGLAPGTDETIALGNRSGLGNQTPIVGSVFVIGPNANPPFEVDFASGRIYVEPKYEGLPVRVTYTGYSASAKAQFTRTAGGDAARPVYLRQIDELTSENGSAGPQQVPLLRAINESQPYAFLDVVSMASSVTRLDPAPFDGNGGIADPTLQAGRVWLFWSSPRGRQGVQTDPASADLFPTGFDLYWQTLAPNFDPKTYSGLPPR